jgi:hypothetical protein
VTNAINRVFIVALLVAVVYFAFELLFRTFALPPDVQRVSFLVSTIIFAPALPVRLLLPGLSLTTYLIVACLGWGILAQLGRVIRQRTSPPRPPLI